MKSNRYEITESVVGFTEGDVFDVTARFGDWHAYDLKLESRPPSPTSKTVVVSESSPGFSEAEILDETARFGDWHTYDLKFDPVGDSDDRSIDAAAASPGPIRLTTEELLSIAAPVEEPV